MKLPNSERAHVPRQKLTDYLLSESHPVGRFKAAFFRRHGFDERNVALLERRLLEIAHNEFVQDVVLSVHGTKFVIEGVLRTVEGRAVRIATVWIIENDEDPPRFVTAYPA